MKTKNLFGILMLFLFAVTFISCDKDDLTDKVEIVKMYVSAKTYKTSFQWYRRICL